MKSFKDFVNEARRNPDLNPKIGVVQALEPFKNDPAIYISFTEVDKIGINPQSAYETPNGIYTYPLKEIWKDIVNDTIPWGRLAPFVWIVEQRPGIKFINDIYRDYSSKSYDEDYDTLEKISKKLGVSNEDLRRVTKEAIDTAKIRGPSGIFWNLTRLFSMEFYKGRNNGSKWNALLRDLGYDGIADKSGMGIIHEAEPTQAVFLHARAFKVIDKIMNIRPKTTTVKNKDGNNKEMIWDGGTWKNDTWFSGKWLNGVWEDGIWMSGLWKSGTWKNGTWENGTWEKGTWKNGTWEKGTWKTGTWEDGVWRDGIWLDGTWEEGKWVQGFWNNGTWEFGRWESGIWKNGTWEDGKWERGKWEKGTWEYGTWKMGVWVDGTWKKGNWKGGRWEGGTWKNGMWEDGIWENGIWENGVWNKGTWHNGTWKGGLDKYGKFHPEGDSPDKWVF